MGKKRVRHSGAKKSLDGTIKINKNQKSKFKLKKQQQKTTENDQKQTKWKTNWKQRGGEGKHERDEKKSEGNVTSSKILAHYLCLYRMVVIAELQ